MEQLETVTEVFSQITDGDNVLIQTENSDRKEATVMDDTPPLPDGSEPGLGRTQYIFGPPENCEVIVYTYGAPQLVDIDSTGSFTNWRQLTGIVNHTTQEYAGEISDDLLDSFEE